MSFTLDPSGVNIVLRSPDFGNAVRLTANDIRRFTRGGTAKTYADTAWAKLANNTYEFSLVKNTVADDLVDQLKLFFVSAAGTLITIIDHLGITRTGFIVTPVLEIIAVRPNCSYSVSFEFMEEPT